MDYLPRRIPPDASGLFDDMEFRKRQGRKPGARRYTIDHRGRAMNPLRWGWSRVPARGPVR
jgi:hypothetical protein